MAISIASRKQKARLLQQRVRDAILAKFPQLTERDVKSTSMGDSGVDVKLSQAAVDLFPFSVEAKAQESVSLWSWWKQAVTNTEKGTKPLLVIKKSREEPLAVMRFSDFMEIL